MAEFNYPPTRKSDQADNYHGISVPDPYRWLEDSDSPETQDWIARQNEVTFSFLEDLPHRTRLRHRLTELWDYPKASAPLQRGNVYFQLRNSGLQNQDVLFCMQGYSEDGHKLLDPNLLSEDGTVALTVWEPSEDGRYLAYATSASGSDWLTWRVKEVSSGEDLPDLIEWSKFSSAAWLPDSSGFFYACYDKPAKGQAYAGTNYNQKLFFHKLGSSQTSDRLVYQRPDHKDWGFDAQVSEDGRYLIIHVWEGTDTRNRLFYRDLHEMGEVVELISELEAAFHFVGNDGPVFYFRTDLEAPRGRLIAIDTTNPSRDKWDTLIPETNDSLELVKMVNHQFIAQYLHDAYHQIKVFNLSGKYLGEISLPGIGSILSLNGRRPDTEMFFTFHSFVHPPTVYRYNFETNGAEIVTAPQIDFDFSPYQTDQLFVTSKDGTKIPLFLVGKQDLVNDGKNSTLLYGYGGFNISMTPTFSISRLAWLEIGGLLAVACLRGGGEYGEEWHQAGMLQAKQNVFDDFIACAEYLVEQQITSPARLAIQGGSNGGLLVGACMTQRPELFAAALPAVGVMDMLRFHKFTIGWAWVSDYGSSDDPEGFNPVCVLAIAQSQTRHPLPCHSDHHR